MSEPAKALAERLAEQFFNDGVNTRPGTHNGCSPRELADELAPSVEKVIAALRSAPVATTPIPNAVRDTLEREAHQCEWIAGINAGKNVQTVGLFEKRAETIRAFLAASPATDRGDERPAWTREERADVAHAVALRADSTGRTDAALAYYYRGLVEKVYAIPASQGETAPTLSINERVLFGDDADRIARLSQAYIPEPQHTQDEPEKPSREQTEFGRRVIARLRVMFPGKTPNDVDENISAWYALAAGIEEGIVIPVRAEKPQADHAALIAEARVRHKHYREVGLGDYTYEHAADLIERLTDALEGKETHHG